MTRSLTPRRLVSLLTVVCSLASLGGCDDPTRPDSNASLATGSTSDAPTLLGGSAPSEKRIDLTWEDNSRNEAGFEVHRSTTGDGGPFTLRAKTASNVAAYSDQGLTDSTRYCYQVRWYRTSGKVRQSAFSNVHCVRTFGPPWAPTSVTAIPGALYTVWIDLAWAELSGTATGFRVERAALPAGPWDKIAETPYFQRFHRDENRPVEALACYRITAMNTFGDSPPSVRCTTPPEPPGNFAAGASGAQSIDLRWEDKSGAEDGVEIQRSPDGNFWSVAGVAPANATTYRDGGLVTGSRYYYRARATKDGGFSNFTMVATGVAVGTAPASSPSITVSAVGSTVAVIQWASAIADAEGYRAERSVDGGASWGRAGATNAFQTYMNDGGRTPEQPLCYRLFAFNGIGDAPPSAVDCVTPPARVSDLAASPGGDGNIDLRWTDPSSVNTGYVIEYLETYYDPCYYYCDPQQRWVPLPQVGDITSYRVSGLSWDILHQFRVTTLVAKGAGDPSDAVGSYSEFPPSAPSNLTASVVSGHVDLLWADNSTGETYFSVYRCDGTAVECANGVFNGYDFVNPDVTTYSDANVAPGGSFTYRIVAWRGGAASTPSNTASATIPAAPPE